MHRILAAAAGADITVGGGAGGSLLRNQNGVVLRVHSTGKGVDFKIAAEGVKITLD
jgi:hypothetical protein